MIPSRIAAAAAICLSLVAAACGGAGTSAVQRYAKGGTFTLALSTDPGNLDPQQSVLSATGTVDSFLYDTLVSETPQGRVESELATRWKVSPTSVTFTLRNDITCSDGHHLTAQDVARNFDYLQNPRNASPLVGVLLPNPDFTVRADDPSNTVTITMAQPFGFLLQGAGAVPIVCPKGMDDRGLLAHGSDGTGPFVLTQAIPGASYTLRKRPGYRWGPGGASDDVPGFPDQVVVKIIPNQTTAANLLLSGSLNAAAVTGPDQDRLDAAHLFKVGVPALYFLLWYNEAAGHPGADEAVRRALTMDLDLAQVAKVATAGRGTPATGLTVTLPQVCPGNTVAGNLPGYDPSGAARLLDQDGWRKGADGVRSKDGQPLAVTLLEPSAEGDQVAAALELIAQDWQKLGVQVTIKPATDVDLDQILFGTGAWDAGQVPLNNSFPSAIKGFVSGPVPPQGTNFAHIVNPTYDRLSAEALGTPGSSGCKLWNQATTALFRRVDVVPVANLSLDIYAQKARFDLGAYGVLPISIRLLA
jgi:peptide/nickel transport system substrate-binding protein